MFLDSEIRIKVLLNSLEKNVVAFKLSSNKQKKDNRISHFNFYGSLNSLKNSDTLEINGSAKDLPLSFIKALWPENLGNGARAWTNRSLFNGIISDLEFNSKFVFKKDGRLLFDPVINLDFDFNDIEVHYLKNMPPAILSLIHI